MRKAKEFAEAIIETVRQPILVLDADLRVIKANDAFLEVVNGLVYLPATEFALEFQQRVDAL